MRFSEMGTYTSAILFYILFLASPQLKFGMVRVSIHQLEAEVLCLSQGV